MTRADLHVHSRYSGRPSDWFLKRIGARESYTPLEDLYQTAKARGMSFVTVTDHNTIESALKLVEAHPENTFTGAEITAYFPENQCKVHLLVYDIDQRQFDHIDRIRRDIYALRDYLRRQDIAHSVAHGTFSVNGRLTLETLEKLILLFDVFEGMNGARDILFSQVWQATLMNLSPESIDRLYNKYAIEPFGFRPWIKGFTGGSDDHSGIFIANSYTTSTADTREGFLESLKWRETRAAGRCNDFKSFAFSIYKITYEFTRHKTAGNTLNMLNAVSALLFDSPDPERRQVAFFEQFRRDERNRLVSRFVDDLLTDLLNNKNLGFEHKIDRIYHNVAMLFDEYCIVLLRSFAGDVRSGNLAEILKNISSSLPVIFLSVPFFTSIRHLSSNRKLLMDLRKKYLASNGNDEKAVLWFTDTITDLNGVCITLHDLLRTARRQERKLKIVVSKPDGIDIDGRRDDIVNLKTIYSYTSPQYPSYTVQVPSLLKAIEEIYFNWPDEIIVSTPGPVGVLGLIAARLLGVPCKAIYHTDFTEHMRLVSGDEALMEVTENYLKWFYSLFDEILVPTGRYLEELCERDFDPSTMRTFKRGVDTSLFHFDPDRYQEMADEAPLRGGFNLVWSGRVCADKNLAYLFDLYQEVVRQYPETNLFIVGDGPSYQEYRQMMERYERVVFTGRIPHHQMAWWYCRGDLLVFPSTMDTFGMTVVEAQACGCPALVTDVGGPQEIVAAGWTGFALSLEDRDRWLDRIALFIRYKARHPQGYLDMRRRISEAILERYSLNGSLNDIIGYRAEKALQEGRVRPTLRPAMAETARAI